MISRRSLLLGVGTTLATRSVRAAFHGSVGGVASQFVVNLTFETSAQAQPTFMTALTNAAALVSAAFPNTAMTQQVQVGYNDVSNATGIVNSNLYNTYDLAGTSVSAVLGSPSG